MKHTLVIFYFLLSLWYSVGMHAQELKDPGVKYSVAGGFYKDQVIVTLSSTTGPIYYTLDGSYPGKNAQRYTQPIVIHKTSVLRAIVRLKGKKSISSAQTYFINEPHTKLMVISIGVSGSLLFDPVKGLMVDGPRADLSNIKHPGANYWSRKEIRVQAEFFDPKGKAVFNSAVGLRLFGGMSRTFPQKSLVLITRERYGKKRVKYPLFGSDGLKKFKYLVLRNGGSDFGSAHIRDELMGALAEPMDVDQQDSRPALVYINGQYWGLYFIKEKLNKRFFADHYKINPDSLNLIEHQRDVKAGSIKEYQSLKNFLNAHSLEEWKHYDEVCKQIDIDNYIDYQIAQIYCDNRDAGGNIKFWKPQIPGSKWRWALFDTDFGFGLHDRKAYLFNSLYFHTNPNGPSWPNPPWSTFLLRKLLENPEFERKFVNRFCDHLNVTFSPARVHQTINGFSSALSEDMKRHVQRWNLSEKYWHKQLGVLHDFAEYRPDLLRGYLQQHFHAGQMVSLEISKPEHGKIIVNEHLSIKDQVFSGIYFRKYPLHLQAIPEYGYRFVRWEGLPEPTKSAQWYRWTGDLKNLRIKAIFESYKHPLDGSIIINEISHRNAKSGDWIELYNKGEEAVSLNGWSIGDRKHTWKLPLCRIPPNGYVVIATDTSAFRKVHPHWTCLLLGPMGFHLNRKQEDIYLYDAAGIGVDHVAYKGDLMESEHSISLKMPHLKRDSPDSWEPVQGQGSPGQANPQVVLAQLRQEKDRWVRVGFGLAIVAIGLLLYRKWSLVMRSH